MELVEDPRNNKDPDAILFRFPEPDVLKKNILLQADNVSFAFPGGPSLLQNITVLVEMKSRIGMLGDISLLVR